MSAGRRKVEEEIDMKRAFGKTLIAASAMAMALTLAACGDDDDDDASSGDTTPATETSEPAEELSGEIVVDGSSTVGPLTSVAAELFNEVNPNVNIGVAISGTGGGFERFCVGETDISDASRPIADDEVEICGGNGIEYEEFTIANDALTIVVSSENDWATCLTVEELTAIWAEGSQVNNWNQVRPEFPDEPLVLAGPGTDSGTFDYFSEVITPDGHRPDYSPSEDDNIIIQDVEGAAGGMGYFGFSYFLENQESLKAIEVDGGNGCVAPSVESALDGSYTPLSRPIFIYPKAESLQRPEVAAFVEFYVANAVDIAEQAGYVPLNDTQQGELEAALERLHEAAGTGS